MSPERQPWERRFQENKRAWEAFCCYLSLGAGRTLQTAWEAYHASEAQVERRRRKGCEEKPAGNMPGYWTRWSVKWDWVHRAEAKDDFDHAAAEEARFEANLARRAAEDEENERQAKTRLGQLRLGRTAAGAILNKIARAFVPVTQGGTGELIDMPPKEALQYIGKVGTLLQACVAEERKELIAMGYQDAPPPAEGASAKLAKLLDSLRELVPPERWPTLASVLEEIDGGGNGRA